MARQTSGVSSGRASRSGWAPKSCSISVSASVMAVRMPRPSRSSFTSFSASMSCLSNCSTARRPSLERSTGASSSSGSAVATTPPGCSERWRGSPSISAQRRSQRLHAPSPLPTARRRPHRGVAARSAPICAGSPVSNRRAASSTNSCGRPSANPTSRAADRARYVMNVQTIATCRGPNRSSTASITSSRRSEAKSTSTSGYDSRPSFKKRSKIRLCRIGSTRVMPSR